MIKAEPVPSGQPARTVRVRAQRLLKATGADIAVLPPFPLSSTQVRSVGVSDPVLTTPEFLDSDAPVYIIGSGKTAMDTVRHVVQSRGARRRSLNVVIGSGMWFFQRDNLYPRRLQRFTRGILAASGTAVARELWVFGLRVGKSEEASAARAAGASRGWAQMTARGCKGLFRRSAADVTLAR